MSRGRPSPVPQGAAGLDIDKAGENWTRNSWTLWLPWSATKTVVPAEVDVTAMP